MAGVTENNIKIDVVFEGTSCPNKFSVSLGNLSSISPFSLMISIVIDFNRFQISTRIQALMKANIS